MKIKHYQSTQDFPKVGDKNMYYYSGYNDTMYKYTGVSTGEDFFPYQELNK